MAAITTFAARASGDGQITLDIPSELCGVGSEGTLLFIVLVGGAIYKFRGNESVGDNGLYDRDNGSTFVFTHSRPAGSAVGINVSHSLDGGDMIEALETVVTAVTSPALDALTASHPAITLREGGLLLTLANNENTFNGFSPLTDVTLALSVVGKAYSIVKHFSGAQVSGDADSSSNLQIDFEDNNLNGMDYGDHMVLNIIAKNAVGLEAVHTISDVPVRDIAEKATAVSAYMSGSNSLAVTYNAFDRTLITNKVIYSSIVRLYESVDDLNSTPVDGVYPQIPGNQVGSDVQLIMDTPTNTQRTESNYLHNINIGSDGFNANLTPSENYFLHVIRIIKDASGNIINDDSTASLDAVSFKFKTLSSTIGQVSDVINGNHYISVSDHANNSGYKVVDLKWVNLRLLFIYCGQQAMPVQKLLIEINSNAIDLAGYFQVTNHDLSTSLYSIAGLYETEVVNGQTQLKLGENGLPYIVVDVTYNADSSAYILSHPQVTVTTGINGGSVVAPLSVFGVGSDSSLSFVVKTDELPSASDIKMHTSIVIDTDPNNSSIGDQFVGLTVYSEYDGQIYGSVAGVTQLRVSNMNIADDALLSKVNDSDGTEHKKIKVSLSHSNEAPANVSLSVYKRIPAVGNVNDENYVAARWSDEIVLGEQSGASDDANFYVAKNVAKDTNTEVIVDLAGKGIEFGDKLMFVSKTYLHDNPLVMQDNVTHAGDHGNGFGTFSTLAPGAGEGTDPLTFGAFYLLPSLLPAYNPIVVVGNTLAENYVPISVKFDPSPQRDDALSLLSPWLKLVYEVVLRKADESPIETKSGPLDTSIDLVDGKHVIDFGTKLNNVDGFKAELVSYLEYNTATANNANFKMLGFESDGTTRKTRLAMSSSSTLSGISSVVSPPSYTAFSRTKNTTSWTIDFAGLSANGSPITTINGIAWGEDNSLSGVDNSWARTFSFNVSDLTADHIRSASIDGASVDEAEILAALATSNFVGDVSIRLPLDPFHIGDSLTLDGVIVFVNNGSLSVIAASPLQNGQNVTLP